MPAAHLLVMYPAPKDPKTFDRAYQEQHLPYAGSRLKGALGVVSKRVAQSQGTGQSYYAISDVTFPTLSALKECVDSTGGKEALAHAASISTGGQPTVLIVTDDLAG